jgi:hypothetical protein
LTNIAAGLCGSFISRNNDLAGYWAIGKLCSLAAQCAQSTASLDLLALSIQPPSLEFEPVLKDYRCLLQKLVSRSGIRIEEITAAYIAVDFLPQPWPRAVYYKQQWGEQFRVTVTIRADRRPDGIISQAGYCRLHDPDRERRRSGV